MKIFSAMDSETGHVYNVSELQNSEDEALLHRLVCTHCGCLLTFTHTSASRRAFISTRKKRDHDPSCIDFFKREARKVLYQTGEIKNSRLDKNALNSRLARMYRKLKKGSVKPPLAIQRTPTSKAHISKKTDKKTARKQVIKLSPTTDPNASVLKGQGYSKIRMSQLTIDDVNARLVGQTVVLGGQLHQVQVQKGTDPSATLELRYNNKFLPLRIRADVFQYQVGLLDRLQSLQKKFAKVEDAVWISVVAEIQPAVRGDLEAVLRDESALKVNGQNLSVYLTIRGGM